MGNYKFDLDLKEGEIGEKALAKILAGKIEVKTDSKAVITGNVVVEYTSRGKPSGIATTEAKWWAFILMDATSEVPHKVLMIETEKLKDATRRHYALGDIRRGGDDRTSEMVVIPISKLIGG